ncbi:hypothetical protein GJ631_05540 [Natronomonas sp. CBA1123]|uniref:DUF7500 family protein n=1 Tax=Natronomonas sp. CBA1123 TaxID=2668070 RepID=UPI0012E9ABED|nr:hypothetical protein [Natronomonas sp. CBA1123]MUV86050.1 hypothetical protein [Natronomonas sp. CBA1123]
MTRNTGEHDEPARESNDSPPNAPIDENPEGVLDPAELGTPDEVTELSDNRFVVAPDDSSDVRRSNPAQNAPKDDTDDAPLPSGAYAAAVTMRTPDGTRTTQVSTNDVRELFDELLLWYVEGMAPEADPEEALSVLVRESSLSLE